MSGKHLAGLVLLVFASGVGVGWIVKPDSVAKSSPEGKAAPSRTSADRPASPHAKAVRRWMDRIETGGVKEVVSEVPSGELEPLIEAVMGSVWGSLSNEERLRLQSLIGEWAERDLEGALTWARSLPHQKQREVGLVSIAVALAAGDPQAAFGIYAEVEEITIQFAMMGVYEMMDSVYGEAAAKGVEALLEVVRRTPKSGLNITSGVAVKYPENTDFKALLVGLREAEIDSGRSFELNDPLSDWALRDDEAAFAYVLESAADGHRVNLTSMVHQLGTKWGTVEANQWIGAHLAAQSPEAQRALLRESDLGHSSGILRSYIANMPSEESAAEFRLAVVQQAARSSARPFALLEILNDVPNAAVRVAAIETMRGVRDPAGVRHFLTQWGLEPARIEQVVETVQQAAEE